MNTYKELLRAEYQEIINEFWVPYLNNTYELKIKKNINRTKIKNIISIDKIKEYVYNKIGFLPVFVFLTSFCTAINIPGPYNNIEKCLLVLLFLIEGKSIKDMKIYTHSETGSVFYNIYECIFITNKDKLAEWIDKMMENLFGNEKTRILNSYVKNPEFFKHITLLLDGHHNKITLEDIDLKKTELYSYKLRKNGLNTQFIIDMNNICVYISESLPCKMNNDDNMFLNNVNFHKFFKYSDCICFDGLYENTVNEVIDKYNNIGMNININNFCFPIKKDKNIELTNDEVFFNINLGSFRSRIESYFADLSKTFKRLDAQNNVRITKTTTYNLQLKLCCILQNIKIFYEINNDTKQFNNNYFKLWMQDDFDFFNPNSFSINLNNVSNKTVYKLDNIHNIQAIQKSLLDNITNLQNLNIDNRKNKMELDENEDKNVYEVQNIIKHRGEAETLEFYVKWRGYNKQRNSWVKYSDFNETDIIKDYWQSISN